MKRGEVRWYQFSRPDKKRPVVILTRDSALEFLGEVTVAPITTTIRDIPTEVLLTKADGMVKKDEVPKNYDELLSSKWKGRKIALGSDNGSLILSGLMRVWGKEKAIRYFQQLAKQEPAIQAGAPSSRIQLLAAGEFPLTLAAGNTLQTFVSRGAPVEWVPLEPVFVQLNTIVLAAQSRHPNATKLFIDFVLSKKGQEMIRAFHRVPSRSGVDAEPPRMFKGFNRVVQDIEAAANGEATTKLYNEILNIR